ncbi:carbohydrate kinase family protein [Desulfurococcus amylolyticus]|uniref:ATP-dependent 6-phosphofructokinase n=1 Tax=Desulfurococcus amylolyticus (strain DSM 18924 / JCM 16383 / VKM B-2413 / 1221n) TaxID=490899 RepID=B8D4B0_DESA1|nr:ATP-dependent 6-phosphofructokinase [Desulfurococcus amylolyticus 1221n]
MVNKSIDVVTVGHALVDIRIVVNEFPTIDLESKVLNQSWGSGGSAVNVAIGVRRLGMKSSLIARVGFDSFGRIIVDELLREGVDISGLRIGFTQTGFTIVAINNRGEIMMYGYKGAAEELVPDDISEYAISRARWMHIASLRLDTTIRAIELARKHGLTISWDPGRVLASQGLSNLKDVVANVDYIMLNEKEARLMTGIDDYREAAKVIANETSAVILLKRGSKGVYVLSKEYTGEIPAYLVENVIDTTGAGDAFASGFITGILRGYMLRKAVQYGNAVAALKIKKLGSHQVPQHDEVVEFIWEREQG